MGWLVIALAAFFAVVLVWATWKGERVGGWDAIGYGIVAMFMAAPAILGVLVGGASGWRLVRKDGTN